MKITINIPEFAPLVLNKDLQELKDIIKLNSALMLYKNGKFFIEQAAHFANLSIYDFMKECSKNQIPVIHYEKGGTGKRIKINGLTMILIADSSALIALAVVDKLETLQKLFSNIFVPRAVYDEITKDNKTEAKKLTKFCKDKVLDIETKINFNISLGKGESEAVIPNFALEGASDVLVLGSKGVEGKRRRSRRVRRGFTSMPMLPMTDTDDVSANANFGIILYQEQNADFLLCDDKKAKKFAQSFGINVIGSLGVLIKAKKAGLIDAIAPLIETLKESRIYIDENTCNLVLKMAGEISN